MRWLNLLLFATLPAALCAGSWPEKITPVWDGNPPPVTEIAAQRAPFRITGGYGAVVNVPHAVTLPLPGLPEPGAVYALRFRAVFERPGEPGYRHALALQVNGRDLRLLTAAGQLRLMNRGEYLPDGWRRGYRGTLPWFAERNYPVLLAKYRPPEQTADDWEYWLDITDCLKSGANAVTFRHAGSFADRRSELVIRDLALVKLEPGQIRRAAAPPVRNAAEKARFLAECSPADSLLRQARTPEAWLKHFQQRNHQPTTPRSSRMKRGDRLPEYDRVRADAALTNRIISPLSGFPPEQYGDRVDYLTNRTPLRNPDWLAQHNRLSVLWALASAYRCTGDARYAAALQRHLADWCDVAERNYSPGGLPIWDSLSSGVRAKVLCEIIDIMLDDPQLKPETLLAALFILQRHGDYLRHSERTPGNWGITEAEGLAFAGMSLPEFADSTDWARTGLTQLQQEFAKQVYPDGMHKELNWGYHYYGISWFYNSSEMVALNGRNDLQAFCIPLDKLEKMYEIVGRCLHPDLRWSAWGDAADEPGLGKMRHAAGLFPTNPLFRFVATGQGDAPPLFHHFPDSGFYSVRSSWRPDAVHLLAKCGPDGGWHGHFDNGSFELFAYGRNLTPDTGNYTYNHAEGRDWFLASARHQTLTLDDRDIALKFRHLQAEHAPQVTVIAFENQSYPELKHRRALILLRGKYLLVFDEAAGPGTGQTAIHFQTAPGAPLRIDPASGEARTEFTTGANLLIVPLRQVQLTVHAESGLKANSGSKTPRPAMRYELPKNAASPVRFVTALIPVPGREFPTVRLDAIGSDRYRLVVGSESFEIQGDWTSGTWRECTPSPER